MGQKSATENSEPVQQINLNDEKVYQFDSIDIVPIPLN